MSPQIRFFLMMLHCLGATIVLELGLAAALGVRKGRDYVNMLLANCLTNPVVVVLCACAQIFLPRVWYIVTIVICELGAVLTEGLLYRRYLEYRKISPLLLSLMLNAFSFAMGFLL